MKVLLNLLFIFTCSCCFAIPPGQWQCMAMDEKDGNYQATGMSLKEAMLAAKSLCERKAKSCTTAQSFCEQGPLTVDERCIVTDETGRSWDATGPDACKTALELCTNWQFLYGKTSQCAVKHS